MAEDFDKRLVFGVSPQPAEGGNATILLGVPADLWEIIKTGNTSTIDLNKVLGLPIQIVLYGGKDREECVSVIHKHNSKHGFTSIDRCTENFGIDG